MRYFILVLFLISIAVVISCGKSENAAGKKPRDARPATPAKKEVKSESLNEIKEKIRNRHLPRNKYGRKDPFALIGAAESTKSRRTKTGHSPDFILKGIMWDARQPLAVIDGKVVEQGDRIGNKTVEKIEKDSVTLFDGKKRTKLRL